jgi:transposase
MKQIIGFTVDNQGLSEISKETNLSRDTVYKWQKKFELRSKSEK